MIQSASRRSAPASFDGEADASECSDHAPPGAAAARLQAMVDAHLAFVWRSLRRFGLPPADADDAAQRVFLVAGKRMDRIEPGKERAFLFGVAHRVARDARRAAARRPEQALVDPEAPDSAPGPEELTDRKRARVVLDRILSAMPDDVRAVFVLCEIEGMTREEAAEALESPAGTVASRLRRGRELFQSEAARYRARLTFEGGE